MRAPQASSLFETEI